MNTDNSSLPRRSPLALFPAPHRRGFLTLVGWSPLLLLSRPAWSQDGPPKSELQEQAERCRRLLDTSVIDFYLPAALDRIHGGYWENIDADGKFVGKNVKFLTLQARQLWFFSTLALHNIRRDEALAAADHGYQFLTKFFQDREHGGYFSQVDDAGQAIDPRKHVYLNAFALYGLTSFYQASRRGEVLLAAQALFDTLEKHAHDQAHGGYNEFFYRDWRVIDDPSENGYVGAIQTKTYNSHLHILEAYAELYRSWPSSLLAQRIAELVYINTQTVKHPKFACNLDGWRPDWSLVDDAQNLRASYGHDVECAWLTLDAARTIGWSERLLKSWATSTVAYSLQYGYDTEHGGFFYTGPPGEPATDRRKEWWVQAEALVSMLELYRLTGDVTYYQRFAETLDFIERHQVAPGGSWWATLSASGEVPPNPVRTSMWQGAYHNGRALLFSARLLQQLAQR